MSTLLSPLYISLCEPAKEWPNENRCQPKTFICCLLHLYFLIKRYSLTFLETPRGSWWTENSILFKSYEKIKLIDKIFFRMFSVAVCLYNQIKSINLPLAPTLRTLRNFEFSFWLLTNMESFALWDFATLSWKGYFTEAETRWCEILGMITSSPDICRPLDVVGSEWLSMLRLLAGGSMPH